MRDYFQTHPATHTLWMAVQTAVTGTETLAATTIAFVYSLWTEGLVTLGDACTASTTYFVVTLGYDPDGTPITTGNLCGPAEPDRNGDLPVIECLPGTESHLRNMAVIATALFRSGTKVGGHNAADPAGAVALTTAITKAETKRDLDKVAGKLRKVVASDKVQVTAVRQAAHDALVTGKHSSGTGDVTGNRTPKTIAGIVNRLVGEVRTCDWDREDGDIHLETIRIALCEVLADVEATIATREIDEAFADSLSN